MSFFITLPSNASMGIYPENTPGNYSVKLPQPIELSPNYEVGLVEIQFPHTYFNILPGDIWLRYKSTTADLKTGLYKTASRLIDDLNKLIDEAFPDVNMRFFYYADLNKAVLKFADQEGTLTLSDALTSILDFSTSIATPSQQVMQSQGEINLEAHTSSVYVYCDLVSPRVVGDALVPLLRTVPILDKNNTSIFRVYDKPHYLPLSRFSFDTIEVHLANDKGVTLPFVSGTATVTLHLRGKKHFWE